MKFTARLLIVATLLFGSGCAKTDWIDRTLVTVDVTGTWQSTEAGLIEFVLEQQGSRVTGSYRIQPDQGRLTGSLSKGAIEGTVAGDVFRFSQAGGSLESIQGEMTLSGDEMKGDISGVPYGRRSISLRRVDPSSSPGSPPR